MNLVLRTREIQITKLYPLAISRGVSTGSRNLFVEIEDERGNVGLGECAPGTGFDDTLAAIAEQEIQALFASGIEGLSVQKVWQRGYEMGMNPSALAAVDMALWDLLGKQANMPLYRLLGLSNKSVPTSVTIGINPVAVIEERVPDILRRTGGKYLKIKLGNPEGIEADKESYLAARRVAEPFGVGFRIDANGGWNVSDAKHMIAWLAEHGCDYVEQPLARGEEAGLPELFNNRPLPIFLDESIREAKDMIPLADCCDGINLKLMKCGGVTEAMRIVATARACRLQTMIGCMGETSVAISAGAALGELFDHIDLDSQLNLNPDPCTGAQMIDGVVTPTQAPGHGARIA